MKNNKEPNFDLISKRLNKVQSLLSISKKNPKLKLTYLREGNLALLKKKFFGWKLIDETGPWYT